MPVDIVSIEFLDQDYGTITTGVDFLNGSIGDRVKAEITFDVHWEALGVTGSINLAKTNFQRLDGGNFITDGFKANDTIQYSSDIDTTPITFTIAGVTSTTLFFDSAQPSLTSGVTGSDGADIYGLTPVQNVDLFYGIVPNSSANLTYNLLDNTTQKLTSGVVSYSNTTPTPITSSTTIKSWVYDLDNEASTIEGDGALIDTNRQRFKIVHDFYIQPVFLTGQIVNGVLNSSNVPYLANTESLKYTFRIDCRFTESGSNVDKSSVNGNINQYLKSGNVGWFDENGNGGAPEYTLNSITYRETLNNTVVQAIQPNSETRVSININSANNRFEYFNSEFILHIYRTPKDPSVYQNTTTDLKENFLVSRVPFRTGGNPTTTDIGFVKAGASVTSGSNGSVTVDFTFLPTFFLSQDNVIADIQAFNNDPANVADGYLIFVTCQDLTITNKANSDKVAVLCDVNTAEGISLEDFYNTEGVCETVTLFNDHPTNDPNLAFTDYKGWVEDGVLTNSRIQILKSNENQGIDGNAIQNVWNLATLTAKVEAEHKTDVTRFFTLEEKTFIAGLDLTESRNYILPLFDDFNEIVWEEDTASETPTHKYYNLQYPFKLRWEDWKSLTGADNDFPLASQDWVQYINDNWHIKFNLYKEVDVVQAPQTAVSPCSGFMYVDENNFDEGIYFLFETEQNAPSATYTFLPSGYQVTPQNSFTGVARGTFGLFPNEQDILPPIGSPATICIDVDNDSDVIQIDFSRGFGFSNPLSGQINRSKPTGVLDLSQFDNLARFKITINSLTDIVMPITVVPVVEWVFSNITFDLDLSINTNLGDTFYLSDSTLSTLTLPSSSNVFQNIGVYNCPNINYIDLTVLTGANNNCFFTLYNNNWSAAIVDQILVDLDSTGWTATTAAITLTGNTTPTGTGLAAKTNLQGKGWIVITD